MTKTPKLLDASHDLGSEQCRVCKLFDGQEIFDARGRSAFVVEVAHRLCRECEYRMDDNESVGTFLRGER